MPLPLHFRAAKLRSITPLVVGLGLVLSATLAWQAEKFAAATDRQRFERFSERIHTEVTRRVRHFEYGVRGSMSLWPASKSVERGEFSKSVQARNLDLEFPGALGLGFIKRVERADIPSFLDATRADDAPHFKLKTSGSAADLFVIEFIEPLAKNQAAEGYDVGQEAKRRVAAERAMATGQAALTEPVFLVQAMNEGPGFLYFYPIYKNGTQPVTPEQRRAALFGWSYMPIVASRIFATITQEVGDELDFELFNGESLDDSQHIFDADGHLSDPASPKSGDRYAGRQFQATTTLAVGGLTWTLATSTSPKFARATRLGVYSAALGGPLLTALLAGLLLSLSRTTRKAQQLATAMTADLAAAKTKAEMLALVATRTTNAVVITDAQRRITWVNEGFTRISGYTLEESLGKTPGSLLQSDHTDPATRAAMRAALDRGEGFHCEILNQSKTGTSYWLDLDIMPLREPDGVLTGFMAIELDITERKRADTLLKEQAERTELAMESGGLGLWDWNVATGETHFDQRWAAIVGEKVADLKPHVDEWITRCHPVDLPIAQAALQRHFAGETAFYQCRHRVKHRRGHWLWIMDCGRIVSRSAEGKPLRMVGTHHDITSAQLAQLEIERHVTALNHTSRLAKVGAWEFNPLQNTLTWSDQVRAIHEVNAYYEPTLSAATAFYVGEAAATIKGLLQAALDHGTPFDVELPFCTAQGNHLWVRAVGEAQRVGDTTVLVRGALQDVTDSHRQRELLALAKDAAEAASRAKADFLANMSHEIRTPMNAVIGMTELLQSSQLNAEQAEFVGIIRTSGDALLTLINDILDFSKIESGHLELEHMPVNLRDCLETAVSISSHSAASKGLDLMIEIEPGTPEAMLGDSTRLRQVVTNLLSNAIKFTAQGEVLVTLGLQADNHLRFAVRDTGMGIPADKLDRLFKSFSQVDNSITRNFGGTGLGLAISQRLVTLMGGRIGVESTPGQGSTFSFAIPYSATNCPPRPGQDQRAELVGRRLLIVDDKASNRRILANQTRGWGMDTQVVASGVEALQLIDSGTRFDAALIDVQMPDMDGITLAGELRRRLPVSQLPLIALTSQGSTAQAFAGLDVARVLSKPARAEVLQSALRDLFQPKPNPGNTGGTAAANAGQGEAASAAAAKPAAAAAGAESGVEAREVKPEMRILLVEDIEINQQVATLLLGRLGYTAAIANNGVEALEAVAKESFDLIFLDMQMPEMDGLTCAGHLCEKYPEATRPWITAMTANALEGDREKCIGAGMDDYVSKPISGQSLEVAIAKAAEGLRRRRDG
jgi:PAS domain S-box-containing protein